MPFLSCHFSYNERPKSCALLYFSSNSIKRKLLSAPLAHPTREQPGSHRMGSTIVIVALTNHPPHNHTSRNCPFCNR
jgi:hypothetical protein